MNSENCPVCMDPINKELTHTCDVCEGMSCLSCTNQWALRCYNLGQNPSCAFCRSTTSLASLSHLHNLARQQANERVVGEKRKAAGDLWCSEDDEENAAKQAHWTADLPPLTWQTYFKICGLELPAVIPRPLEFLPFLDLFPDQNVSQDNLSALDDPDFMLDPSSVYPIPPSSVYPIPPSHTTVYPVGF